MATKDTTKPRSAWPDLVAYLRPYRTAVVIGGVLILVGSLTGLVQPLMAKQIVDALEREDTVVGSLVLLTVAVVVGAVLSAYGSYLLGRTAQSVVLDSRRALVDRILWLRVPQTAAHPPGDLMSRVTADTTLLREVVREALVEAVRGALMAVGITAMMIVMDPVLTMVTLGVLVLAGAFVGAVVPFYVRYNDKIQGAVAQVSTTLERALGAFRTIKAAGAEPHEAARVNEASVLAWKYGVRHARLEGVVGAVAGLAIHVSFLAVLGIGGARVASGQIPVGTLIAFLLYLFYLLDPVLSLVGAATNLSAGIAAVRRIREVRELDVEPGADPRSAAATERAAGPSAEPVDWSPAAVRFQDVVFGYPGTAPVHHGVSFELPPGGITAIVGPSGAGKSTVFALLERFYEPDSGRILLDGRELSDWPLHRLRAAIGYVEQDAPVLAGTLRENLLIGVGAADEQELHRVLERTRLDALVAQLPDGVDTRIGHRGNTLSGGERQRIAVARALLRKPRLLLLDEVTSQLDAVNELALRDAIAEAGRELTVMVVAHRLSTVTQADRIVVMDAGRVRAIGTHSELLQRDALYTELATTQLLVAEGSTAGSAAGK